MQRIGLAVVLALSVVLAPLTDEAHQPGKVYRIGVLTTSSGRPLVNEPSSPYRAFLQALRELGYTEGQNVVIERRSVEDMLDRVPAAAAELARLHVDVIVAAGPVLAGPQEARLANQSTSGVV